MLRMINSIWLSGILLSFIDVAEEDEIGSSGSDGIKFLITSKTFSRADYLNFKGILGAKGFGYLIPDAKKAFNQLWHAFTKAPIF